MWHVSYRSGVANCYTLVTYLLSVGCYQGLHGKGVLYPSGHRTSSNRLTHLFSDSNVSQGSVATYANPLTANLPRNLVVKKL